ncbi:uncharacterized protein [Antedon mediterranea]|uniref:uncharacterized protein n=1 Tax=Antedon mediterranea TaxID=105859 RepID=UPI003AF56E2E
MCNVPDAPTYGTVSTNEMVDHGDTIEFACSTGLVLEPATPTIYTCNDGSLEYNIRKHCIDFDECTQDIPCGSNAQCTNTFGSYSCECNDGFEDEGEGQGCEDIDECARGTDTCSDNALCTDTTGSYTCECNDGYRGDGFECIEILYFDYGSTYGDSSLRETFERNTKALGEYISPSFTPPNGFPVGSEFLPKLYFTENGIFILVNNNDDIVSYTYPPSSGFVSGDRRNIIAPFWADGDMSTDIGDVLYQEYVSGDEDAQLFLPYLLDRLTELTAAASITLPTDFTPTWALKVTWLDIAQRPATASTRKTLRYL